MSSNVLHISTGKLETIGEIQLPNANKKFYSVFRGYFITRPLGNELSLSEFKGGVLFMTDDCFYSMKFNKELNYCKTYAQLKLENIFILNPHHVLVLFKDKNFFDIYDLFTGELVTQYTFNSEIKYILPDLRNDYMVNLRSKETKLIIVLEKCEIKLATFNPNTSENERIVFDYELAPAGIECMSLALSTLNDLKRSDLFALTLEDGSVIVVEKSGVRYAKPKFNNDQSGDELVMFKIVNFMRSGLVLLGKHIGLMCCNHLNFNSLYKNFKAKMVHCIFGI